MIEPMTPYVNINLDQVKQNLNQMIVNLSSQDICHRPHVKTHKSVELAKMAIDAGAIGVTCATLTELEIMAKGGIDNILLAFPIITKQHLNKLYEILNQFDIEFTTIVDSDLGIKGLNLVGERLNRKINVLLDIDSGGHREGVQSEDVLPFANKIIARNWLRFSGLFTYFGHIYNYDQKYHEEKTLEEANILLKYKQILEANEINVSKLSGGSTVSSNHPKQLKGITESRAGNFIFYDMNAVHLGIVTPAQCALRVISTIVSIPIPGKATIDAGSKALSTDRSLNNNDYGYIQNKPELHLVNLNEEHGFLEYDPDKVELKVGDKVEIIPNHSCVIPNLHNQVFISESNLPLRPLKIDARYRNYL